MYPLPWRRLRLLLVMVVLSFTTNMKGFVDSRVIEFDLQYNGFGSDKWRPYGKISLNVQDTLENDEADLFDISMHDTPTATGRPYVTTKFTPDYNRSFVECHGVDSTSHVQPILSCITTDTTETTLSRTLPLPNVIANHQAIDFRFQFPSKNDKTVPRIYYTSANQNNKSISDLISRNQNDKFDIVELFTLHFTIKGVLLNVAYQNSLRSDIPEGASSTNGGSTFVLIDKPEEAETVFEYHEELVAFHAMNGQSSVGAKETGPPQERSFLAKYWWMMALAVLAANILLPTEDVQEQPQQQNQPTPIRGGTS